MLIAEDFKIGEKQEFQQDGRSGKMLTAESLRAANSGIKLTDVKGKAYAEVNQRIKAFRSICPNGSIATEIVRDGDGICIMKAVVSDENGNVLGIGHAYEREGSTYINKTSYIENCETSAVGRALGMCGIGIDTAIASAEEVQNAVAQQVDVKQEIKKYSRVIAEAEGREPKEVYEDAKAACPGDLNAQMKWLIARMRMVASGK